MNNILKLGSSFSRDCFLCLGGTAVLTAVAALAISLPRIMWSSDWHSIEAAEMFFTTVFCGACGGIFLAGAYGLFRSKPWRNYFAAFASALSVALLTLRWCAEIHPPARLGVILAILATPLSLVFVWAVASIVSEWIKQRTLRSTGIPRNQIA
ncbi:MAG TPA: hypothetical protein VMD78_14370 [Candidatus Baltobacteraceae bacterium]|nr:hypothetical protein [Candidatus Baltobacteraceae bacterium]